MFLSGVYYYILCCYSDVPVQSLYIMLLFWCSCVEYILWCCSCVSFVEFIYYGDVSLQSLYIMLFLWRFFVEFIYDAGVPLQSSYIILWRLLVMDLVLLCGVGVGWSWFLYSFVELVLVDRVTCIPLWSLCWFIVILVFLCGIYDGWSCCLCSFVEFVLVDRDSSIPLWNLWWLIVLHVFLCAMIMWCDSCVPKYYDTTKIKVFSVIYLQRNMAIDLWRYFELHNRIRQHSNDLSSQDEITDLMFSIISAWFKSICSFT